MKLHIPSKLSLYNRAYLKERITREDMDGFKKNFVELFKRIKTNEGESEENRKNLVSDFLKDSFYKSEHEINTKDKNDLVIHIGKGDTPVAVLFEVKKPNASEMMTIAKPNNKALQQLAWYYFKEREEKNNRAVKHLIATDIYNWFIFDENIFDKYIYRNKKFLELYTASDGKDTDYFYKGAGKIFDEAIDMELACTHFDLRTYEKLVRSTDEADDNKLLLLHKVLSPINLLKLPFKNDSNQLNENFYKELLHIIGLEEVKEGSKKLIQRKKQADEFSILENAVTKIENKGLTHIAELSKFGTTKKEQFENIALELCITWINRILFLKLLEAQLVTYHRSDKNFKFLSTDFIRDYDRINKLFFEVLAEKPENRKGKTQSEFEKIPYLNSSLFERTELERHTIEINYLDDDEPIPILGSTVLKDNGKKKSGALPALTYLLEFLDSFDFASEGTGGIIDGKRTLINASVLGLIFEKINGYKDGSFFTPGFITMYMCRETIRRAVVQKFRENGFEAETFDALKDEINESKTDRKTLRIRANDIINSIKICDPAVGSGHFLVSALNEMIAIKSELGVLMHRDQNRVTDYVIEVQNDELIVVDENSGEIFQYSLNLKGTPTKEAQALQQTLFHEKQTIIENCLFGVDINPNSVKICRLRLWIELLKNAYYTEQSGYKQLETLPNIDINIKQGNSLISRYKLEDDLSDVFKRKGFSYKDYRNSVEDYKNTNSKEDKQKLSAFIGQIKEQFQTAFHTKLKEYKELAKFKGLLTMLRTQDTLFADKKDIIEEVRLEKLVEQYQQIVNTIKDNTLNRDAFEWRFEFPEVLNDAGNFNGFDVVIGNPPYIRQEELGDMKNSFEKQFKVFISGGDIFSYFYELSYTILRDKGQFSFINNTFDKTTAGKTLREFVTQNFKLERYIDFTSVVVFDEATTYPIIIVAEKNKTADSFKYFKFSKENFNEKKILTDETIFAPIVQSALSSAAWNFINNAESDLLAKIGKHKPLSEIYGKCYRGIITGLNEAIVTDKDLGEDAVLKPVYDGRDLKKWKTPAPFKKMIVFEAKSTKKIFGNLDESAALTKMQTAYPKIFNHLLPFETAAKKRYDQGEYWWELRNCAYYDLFAKSKIIFPNLQNANKFSFDESGVYINAPAVFLPTDNIFLLAILNSKLVWHFLKSICVVRSGGFIEVKPQYFEQIPIVEITQNAQQPLITLVEKILAQKKVNPHTDTSNLEKELDVLVYALYDLTPAEIEVIEGTVGK